MSISGALDPTADSVHLFVTPTWTIEQAQSPVFLILSSPCYTSEASAPDKPQRRRELAEVNNQIK
jgi:hypothetical protein